MHRIEPNILLLQLQIGCNAIENFIELEQIENLAGGVLQSKRAYAPRTVSAIFLFLSHLSTRSSMPTKFAILLDAGFLKRKIGSINNPMIAEQVVEFTEKIKNRKELAEYTLHRIYYYDAEPLEGRKPKPLTGSRDNWSMYDFSDTLIYRQNKQLLSDLRKESFFAIRLGEVSFRGWRVKPQLLQPGGDQRSLTVHDGDLVPNIKQKGVDLRIGLDIAALTLKQHVEIIVLVTGDSDFVPALKFARREGKLVFLYSLGHGIDPDLYTHADVYVDDSLENF